MPHISQNPVVCQLFDEFSKDTRAWANMNLIPSALEYLVRGKEHILLKNPDLKQEEIAYLKDCFNTVYEAVRQKNSMVPKPVQRPVVSVLDVIAQAKPKPVEVKADVKITRNHGTQTD